MRNRQEIIQDLLGYKKPTVDLLEELSQFEWDSEPIVVMARIGMLNVLNKFIEENVSAEKIEEWANAVECREDIDFENEEDYNCIVELANPVLYGEITPDRIVFFRNELFNKLK